MARKKKHDDHGGGGGGGHGGASGRWLVSYSDFITLLMVVFLVLFSFSRLDVAKYESLAQSLRGSLGGAGGGGGSGNLAPFPSGGASGVPMPIVPPDQPGNMPDVPDWPAYLVALPKEGEALPDVPTQAPPSNAQPSSNPKDPVTAPSAPASSPKDAMEGVADTFRALPGVRSGLMSVALEDRGVVLSVAGSLLFEPGQVELKPDAAGYLDEIAGRLRGTELPIMVTGTADTEGRGSAAGFPPYKVASLRTSAVIDYFVKQKGLPSSSFVFFGSGEAPTDGDGRVTVVVLRKK